MTGPQPSEDRLLKDLIKTNNNTDGKTLTKKQYEKHGDYNPWQAANRFNSWNEARASAGIYKKQAKGKKITDKKLLEDVKKVNQQVNGLMKVSDYKKHGNHSISLIYSRFNSFPTARSKAYNI